MEDFWSRGLEIKIERLLPIAAMQVGAQKDPFDRLLVAQAGAEGLTLLMADQHLARYGDVVRVV